MKDEYIAFGPNYWGRGETIAAALSQLRKAGRGSMGMRGKFPYAVYKVGPDTTVDGMGALCYPSDGPKPELVERRERKAK